MKKLFNHLFFIVLFISGLLHAADMAYFINSLKQPENKVKFCREGFGFITPSIRMGSGEECTKPVGATLAEYICSGHSDYNKSKCAGKAAKIAVRTNEVDFLAAHKAEVCRIINKTISSLSDACNGIKDTVAQMPTPTVPKPTAPAQIPAPPPGLPPAIKPAPALPPQSSTPTELPKPIANQINSPKYAIMGIEYLHQKGIFGLGVKVGVLDDAKPSADSWKQEMGIISPTNPGSHGTFVSGIIAGPKPLPNNIRLGIAPLAMLEYRNYPFRGNHTVKIKFSEPHFIYDPVFEDLYDTAQPGITLKISYADWALAIQMEYVALSGITFNLPMNANLVSETNMLKDRGTDRRWFKMLDAVSSRISEAAKKDELKKIDNVKDLIEFIRKIDAKNKNHILADTALQAILDTRDADGNPMEVFASDRNKFRFIKGIYEFEFAEKVDKNFAELIDGFREKGHLIINMSLSFPVSAHSKAAIKRFGEAGGIIVVAAGNLNYLMSKLGYPNPDHESNVLFAALLQQALKDKAFAENFILVGALDPTLDNLASFSARAGDVAPQRYIAAWGEKVTSYRYGGGFDTGSGTSYAAPMVTGVLALLKEAFPKCSPRELAGFLLDSADSLGANQYFLSGKGRMNAKKAYDKILSSGKCK